MEGEPIRAGIYCRISSDRTGTGLGVARQEKECRELADRLGWQITAIYTDNDISASGRKKRPAYQELLTAIKHGAVNGLLVWHTDRLHRNVRELLDFLDIVRETDLQIRTVQAGHIDLTTPTGRALAVTFGAWAQQESEHKSERIKAKARQLAEAGMVGGGGSRPFGYEDDRLTVRDSEADLIRSATYQVLAQGMPLRGICREWNAAGIPTPSGNRWSPHGLRRLLMSARISGRREHKGVIVAQAIWPGIISPAENDRLREILADPSRTTNGGDTARRYLLTGFLWCGVPDCGRKLMARPQGDHQRSYVCADVGMSHLRIHAESVELYVTEAAFDYLSEFTGLDDALRAGAGDDQEGRLWVELRNYQQALEDVESRFYVHRKLPEATFNRLRLELEANIQRVRGKLSHARSAAVVASLPGGVAAARAQWQRRGLDWRRLLLRALVDRVTVGPAVRGRNRFDPERVSIAFRRP